MIFYRQKFRHYHKFPKIRQKSICLSKYLFCQILRLAYGLLKFVIYEMAQMALGTLMSVNFSLQGTGKWTVAFEQRTPV
jgi:hypothetical protein